LAKDADVSEADVKFALADQGLGDWFSIKDGLGLVKVKDHPQAEAADSQSGT